jgi:Putative cyclase
MTPRLDGDPMTAADAQAELARIGYTLKPLDIVLVRTGRDTYYGQADYMFRVCELVHEMPAEGFGQVRGNGITHLTQRGVQGSADVMRQRQHELPGCTAWI